MTDRNILAAAALVLGLAASAGIAAEPELERLLAASDLFAKAPAEFRTEIEVRPLDVATGNRLEVFRKGRDLELIRFLAPKERGKFLLRSEERLYFLSPGSAKPVELAPSYRVHGAAIHDLLGLDLGRDFRIDKTSEAGSVVTFDLVATAPGAAAKRLRWAVNHATSRPLRAELHSSQGKVLRVLEFKGWRDAALGVPEILVVKDLVAGGTPLQIRFLDFEPRPIDAALFDLTDGAARAALPSLP
jgi:hypothetical protein